MFGMCERSVLGWRRKENSRKPSKKLQENVSLAMKDMYEIFSFYFIYFLWKKEMPYIMYR